MKLRLGTAAFGLALLAGCAAHSPAPVVTRSLGTPPPISQSSPQAGTQPAPSTPAAGRPAPGAAQGEEFYTVKRGDTLYGIALDHGVGYRELAEWNNLSDPNVIRVDQVLRMRAPGDSGSDQGGVQVRPLADAAQPQVRPLGEAALPPSRPLGESTPARPAAPRAPVASELVKSEPRALKLPYSEENLAAMSQSRPAVPSAAPAPAASSAAAALAPRPGMPAAAEIKPVPAPPAPAAQPAEASDEDNIDWGWPTAGRVSVPFSETSNKGVDINGKDGQPVLASASGTVLYVGSGIRGYGKLIVIRHNKAYSTVYAHNSAVLVKEGQHVVKGQKVAEMGNTDSDQVKLHFEIRRLGKPVDPAKLLPAT